MIDVLLISPRLPTQDSRFGGDHGYTQTLLSHPPDGVRYYHHETLIAEGHGRRIRHFQILVSQLSLKGMIAPGLWFESFETNFVPDLIHIVSFSALVRVHGARTAIPVIIGTSTGSSSDLRYYFDWPEGRIRRDRIVHRTLLRLIGAYETALNPRDASRVLVWSEFARKLHVGEGFTPPNLLEVLPPGIPRQSGRTGVENHPLRFLFIGRNFERKNGPLVLKAFRQIRAEYPAVELVVVGQPADGQLLSGEGVTHYPFLPRRQLTEEIMPAMDVLLLPSKAEGFGLVLLEAMSCNLALIGVDAYAMPEVIQQRHNGFLIRPDSLEDLIGYMRLVAAQPELLQYIKHEAKQIFEQKFAVEVHNCRLRAIYDQALSGVTD